MLQGLLLGVLALVCAFAGDRLPGGRHVARGGRIHLPPGALFFGMGSPTGRSVSLLRAWRMAATRRRSCSSASSSASSALGGDAASWPGPLAATATAAGRA